MSVELAAQRAGVSARSVYRWVQQGRVTAHDNGTGRRMVSLREVLAVEADIRMRVGNRQRQRLVELLGEWPS